MVEPPITKGCGIRLKGAYNSFYFEFKFRKSRTIKGMQCASFNVQLSANSSTIYPLLPCLVSMWFSFQFGANMPKQHCCGASLPLCRQQWCALKFDRWRRGYFLHLPSPPTVTLDHLHQNSTREALLTLPLSIGAPQPSPIDSPPILWEIEPPNCDRELSNLFFIA
jgi:hypothetical protein